MEDYRKDKLTKSIIARVIRVHQKLGPGFLESIYKRALVVELTREKIPYEMEKEIVVLYEGMEVGRHFLDLVVAGEVIIELKAVQELNWTHYAQLRSYLSASGLRVGLLVNFSKSQAEYRRIEL